MKYTIDFLEKIKKIKEFISSYDSILIGAGAGLSTSAGMTYSGKRFFTYFSDFHAKYGITDMYSGGFYPFETLEEYWAWWSRHIYYNRYVNPPKDTYKKLFELVKNKNYFVITTNVDHLFQRNGFDKKRLFYTQGDYGLFQCSKPCQNETYDNEEIIKKMVNEQKDMKIPSSLIPLCHLCGRPLIPNLRCDNSFVEDKGWHIANERYQSFLKESKNKKILFLELGVGENTPVIIKYPFWKMTLENPNARYVCINLDNAYCSELIEKKSICIEGDIDVVLKELLKGSL